MAALSNNWWSIGLYEGHAFISPVWFYAWFQLCITDSAIMAVSNPYIRRRARKAGTQYPSTTNDRIIAIVMVTTITVILKAVTVTLWVMESLCHRVTLLPCHLVTSVMVSPCYHVTLLPVSWYHFVTVTRMRLCCKLTCRSMQMTHSVVIWALVSPWLGLTSGLTLAPICCGSFSWKNRNKIASQFHWIRWAIFFRIGKVFTRSLSLLVLTYAAFVTMRFCISHLGQQDLSPSHLGESLISISLIYPLISHRKFLIQCECKFRHVSSHQTRGEPGTHKNSCTHRCLAGFLFEDFHGF